MLKDLEILHLYSILWEVKQPSKQLNGLVFGKLNCTNFWVVAYKTYCVYTVYRAHMSTEIVYWPFDPSANSHSQSSFFLFQIIWLCNFMTYPPSVYSHLYLKALTFACCFCKRLQFYVWRVFIILLLVRFVCLFVWMDAFLEEGKWVFRRYRFFLMSGAGLDIIVPFQLGTAN